MEETNVQIGILIPIYNAVYFSPSMKMAKVAESIPNCRHIFLIEHPELISTYQRLEIEKTGYKVFYQLANKNFMGPFGSNFITNLLDLLRLKLFSKLVYILRLYRILDVIKRECQIELALLPADNRYYYPFINKFFNSKNRKLPVVIFPSWFANEDELIKTHSDNRDFLVDTSCFNQAFIPEKYLRQLSSGSNKGKFMIPFERSEIILRNIFRAEVPNPWILHSGYANKILVETRLAYQRALKLGFNREQLSLVGSVFLDEMHDLRTNYLTQFDRPGRKLRVLSAFPPNMFSYPVRQNTYLSSYEELLNSWCDTLLKIERAEISVVLHPSSPPEVSDAIEARGLVVATGETHKLIAESDLYIASISATIQWAIAIGVPTINIDVYGYDYPDYELDPSVTQFQSLKQASVWIDSNLSTDTSYRKYFVLGRASIQTDGNSSVRIAKQLKKILDRQEDEGSRFGID